jgi:glutathione synthase/RimK-type ligase-like ATP-grasp enzyme
MSSSAARNKWLKYEYLKKSEQLEPHLPETRKMTKNDFWDLISKYRKVIVKPVKGSRGRGVIQIKSKEDDMYALHYEKIRLTVQGKEDTYKFLKRKIGSASYMVQRRVSRPKINGRPFDLRVIIQRRKNSDSWKVTGKVAKVAGRGYIVSNNSRSKGDLLEVLDAFKRSTIKHLDLESLQAEIDKIALLAAETLAAYFPGHRIFGLDMGPDRHGHIWIIEANLFPSRSHFRKLKDKTMYRKITEYQKG